MAFYNDNYVITGPCRVVWDGITGPEQMDDGTMKYSIKVAQLASAPETVELQTILDRELSSGQFRGVLPPGALPGISDVRPGEFGDMLPGHKVFNTVTYKTAPDVYDVNGQKLDPMQYSAMLYAGATVQLIVAARTYNNVSKGLGFWLSGIKILDATSPKLPVSGGVDAAAAFGAAPAATVGNTSAPGAAQPTPAAAASAPAPMAAPAAQSVAPAPGPSAPPPAPVEDFLTVNGQQYTADQLRAAKWSEEQIAAAR